MMRDRVTFEIELRRQRDSLLGPSLFADPAWDFLLHLYLAELDGRLVSVPSLAAKFPRFPLSSCARWLRTLEEARLWPLAEPARNSGSALANRRRRACERCSMAMRCTVELIAWLRFRPGMQ